MNKIILMLILGSFFLSCSEKSTNPEQTEFSLSGNLIHDNKSLSNATVSLDNKINFTTTSNSDGRFTINNIPKGEYNLIIEKTFDNGSFLEKSTVVEVNSDVDLKEIKLPLGVYMYEPKNLTSSEVTILWSPTEANDFREYKLFRNTTSGIDENNGTLVHVSTTINDTSFVDTNLNPLSDYFYRVYIMNEFGKLGGSNIVKITTSNNSLIENGDFEEVGVDSLPTKWDFRNNLDIFDVISDGEAYSGQNYLLINPNRYVYDLSWGSLQYRVPYTNLVPDSQYSIEFWYYIDELNGNAELFVEFNPEQSTSIWDRITNQQQYEWLQYERSFTVPSNISEDYYLRFEVRVNIPYNNEPYIVRIDNVSITKIN